MVFEHKKFKYDVPWEAEGKYNKYEDGGKVTDAYDALNAHNQSKPGNYVMGTDAVNAKNALNSHIANNNPGAYNSLWTNQLNEIMGKILNREDFSYDFNGDALYQQYKDKFTKQGKMAMADTMGQAAAMTGGYGSSYASTAGNQAYQASLENLNDVIPELYQMAYDRYNQKGQDLYNQYALISGRDATDYGRYRDKVADYNNNRDYLTNAYYNERNFDYGKHRDNVSDWQTDRSYLRGVYENERAFDYGKWDSDRTFDYNKWDSDRSLAHSEHTNSENIAYNEFVREEAKKAAEEAANTGGGYTSGADVDADGKFDKATFAREDEDGNYVFYQGGKEKTLEKGVNPYTGSTNKDTQYGTFSNGYQPNNVASEYDGNAEKGKFKKSGEFVYVNGVKQNVWKTPDGELWVWDGTENKYFNKRDINFS